MLRSQAAHRKTLVEVEPKMTKFENCKKSDKINLTITAKPHAHIQILTKTPAKFQKDLAKMVGVAFMHSQDTQCLLCFGRS